MIKDGWEAIIGMEIHAQLATATKIFCGCPVRTGVEPNSNTCPVCLGLPGALPVLNKRAVDLGARAALALGLEIQPTSIFARKNYFYPDLPKGYQISQYDKPLATGGRLEIPTHDASRTLTQDAPRTLTQDTPRTLTPDAPRTLTQVARRKTVRITRVHLEEDAGKSLHDRFPGVTAIDLNRAGVPLIEIVSEPDMRSADEAGSYLRTLKQILEYMDVSDVSMEAGSLRVDANVSARKRADKALGQKTEVKNMNSFSGVERALEVEFARQCALLERGERVEQQTMLWDASTGQVRPARTKEASHDYRYFPEPDLPPLVLEKKWVKRAREDLPELPAARRLRFEHDYHLSAYDIEVLMSSAALSM